ncbi:MAG TPA: MAPEG family protein [Myxococcota bacterium]|jgi:uncharacterized MAPEG superfamily protein
MTTPFWCILIAGLLPYVWSGVAVKARVDQFGQLDNRLPRLQQAQLQGFGARALGASANAFETFPLFAAAVIVAHIAGAEPGWSATWSVVYVASRILHGICYASDLDKARSAAFGLGQACSIALFVLAARAA